MRVVVDANVVAAALIRPGGWTAQELARTDVEWIAPAFLLDELEEHGAEYAAKAGCALAEWERRRHALVKRLRLVAAKDLAAADGSALVKRAARADPDDAVYVAALVAAGADLLWTRDAALLDALRGIAVTVVPRG
jgi:predicted nucleic acid-binding protein